MIPAILQSYPARFLFVLTAILAAVAIIAIRTALGKSKSMFQAN